LAMVEEIYAAMAVTATHISTTKKSLSFRIFNDPILFVILINSSRFILIIRDGSADPLCGKVSQGNSDTEVGVRYNRREG
jgi:hypothetical protein